MTRRLRRKTEQSGKLVDRRFRPTMLPHGLKLYTKQEIIERAGELGRESARETNSEFQPTEHK